MWTLTYHVSSKKSCFTCKHCKFGRALQYHICIILIRTIGTGKAQRQGNDNIFNLTLISHFWQFERYYDNAMDNEIPTSDWSLHWSGSGKAVACTFLHYHATALPLILSVNGCTYLHRARFLHYHTTALQLH